jgi:hypothetical protein
VTRVGSQNISGEPIPSDIEAVETNKLFLMSTLIRQYCAGSTNLWIGCYVIEGAVMNVLFDAQDRFDEASVTTARLAQAVTIEGFDRLVRARAVLSQVLPAAVRPDQPLIRRLVSNHADLVDRQYAVIGRLLGLHREFAQRLFDVLGAHELQVIVGETTQPPANVIALRVPRKPR